MAYFVQPFDSYEMHFAQTYGASECYRHNSLGRGASMTYKKKLIEVALPLAVINSGIGS